MLTDFIKGCIFEIVSNRWSWVPI